MRLLTCAGKTNDKTSFPCYIEITFPNKYVTTWCIRTALGWGRGGYLLMGVAEWVVTMSRWVDVHKLLWAQADDHVRNAAYDTHDWGIMDVRRVAIYVVDWGKGRRQRWREQKLIAKGFGEDGNEDWKWRTVMAINDDGSSGRGEVIFNWSVIFIYIWYFGCYLYKYQSFGIIYVNI